METLVVPSLRAHAPFDEDFSADELDLKLLGARPFVDATRVLALGAGSPETGTAARLRGAAEPINDIERRVLKGAFRQAALLQERLRLDYGL